MDDYDELEKLKELYPVVKYIEEEDVARFIIGTGFYPNLSNGTVKKQKELLIFGDDGVSMASLDKNATQQFVDFLNEVIKKFLR